MKKFANYLVILCSVLLLSSCGGKNNTGGGSDPSGGGVDPSGGFSQDGAVRQVVLEHWLDDIIEPAFLNYQKKLDDLAKVSDAFVQERNSHNLGNLKTQWLESYKAFQRVLIFDFGFAERSFFVQRANTYPTSPAKIKKNIALLKSNKTKEIALFPTGAGELLVYQGFPALDYLLFDDEAQAKLFEGEDAQATAQYIQLLVQTMKLTCDKIVTRLKTSHNTYVQALGTASSSSFSQTLNGFIRAYEKYIRAEKVGYAVGKINVQNGKPAPTIIEAYYNNQHSKDLLLVALHASQDFFNGKSFKDGKDGVGVYDILVEKKYKKLADNINHQYDLIYKKLESMPQNFRDLALKNNAPMKDLYDLLQKNVAYYKSQMLAALAVSVNFQDTDGD